MEMQASTAIIQLVIITFVFICLFSVEVNHAPVALQKSGVPPKSMHVPLNGTHVSLNGMRVPFNGTCVPLDGTRVMEGENGEKATLKKSGKYVNCFPEALKP
jgi:hypothetical protein